MASSAAGRARCLHVSGTPRCVIAPAMPPSDPHGILGPVVEDKHESATDTSEDIRQEALVEAGSEALLGCDLLEAVSRALVEMLLHWLFGLHLQTASHSVEGVGCPCANRDRCLRCSKCSHCTHHALVRLVRVEACNSIKASKLQSTVADNANNRNTKPSVEGQETARSFHRLHDAVSET